jgi:hypothetical protein
MMKVVNRVCGHDVVLCGDLWLNTMEVLLK